MRRTAPGTLRAAAAALALLAAGSAWNGGEAPRVRVLLVDGSRSARVDGLEPWFQPHGWTELPGAFPQAVDGLPGLVVFADGILLLQRPGEEPAGSGEPRLLPDAGETDIAAGLRAALALIPGDARGEIRILTDGRATKGDTAAALAEARLRGVEVRAFPFPGGPLPARVADLEAPSRARPGERLPLGVTVTGSPGSRGTVVLEDVQSGGVERRDVTVPPGGRGRVVFSREAGTPGVRRYRAFVEGAESARAGAAILVEGEASVVRLGMAPPSAGTAALLGILSGGSEERGAAGPAAIAALLERMDLSSTALLVLDDLPESALPPGGGERLARAVEGGMGLAVLGGPRSLGAGGYAARPLEEALPVRCAPERPRPLVVLALDASGSMEGAAPGGGTLAAEARAAAAALVERLPRDARLALVWFHDAAAAPVELFDLADAAGRTAAVEAALRVVRPGGGTRFTAAAEGAREAASRAPGGGARVLVIVTDGKPSEDADALRALGASLLREGILPQVVPVGPDADVEGMADFVTAGGGRMEAVGAEAGKRSLADALLRASSAADPSLWSPDPVAVRVGPDPAPWGAAPSGLPAAAGRNRVFPRKDSALWLTAGDGAPLLAAGRRGLGRSVVFAAPPGGGDAAWTTPPAAELLAAALRWATRRPGEGEAEASARLLSDGRVLARLTSGSLPSGEVRAGGHPLRRTGPSAWEGVVPPEALDGGVLSFTAGEVSAARAAAASAPSAEDAALGPDPAALAALEVPGRASAGRRGGAGAGALAGGLVSLILLLAAAGTEARSFAAPRSV